MTRTFVALIAWWMFTLGIAEGSRRGMCPAFLQSIAIDFMHFGTGWWAARFYYLQKDEDQSTLYNSHTAHPTTSP